MPRWEVFYAYTVDASIRVDAETKQEAIEKVTRAWEESDEELAKPKTLDYSDFEVLYVKKR